MPLEEILILLRAKPFAPFRIHVTEGTCYDVTHPEACMPLARSLVIGIPGGPQLPSGVFDRYSSVALIHVTRLEPLPLPTGGNGQSV
jgi:hypothetical protein